MPAIHRLFAGHAHPNPSTDEPLGHWLHSSPIGSKKYPAVEHSELASTELTPLVQSPTTCAFVDGERLGEDVSDGTSDSRGIRVRRRVASSTDGLTRGGTSLEKSRSNDYKRLG